MKPNTVRLLCDQDGRVIKVLSPSGDVRNQIADFVEAETYGMLSEIEYYNRGTYDITYSNSNDAEYEIMFSADNGILTLVTRIVDVSD